MTGDSPAPGFYKTRLIRNGPFVPARVWMNETEKDDAGDYLDDQCLMMSIDGERVNGQHMGEKYLWMYGNPIDKAEYDFMRADSDHAKEYRPEDAKANPRRSIDLANSKSVF